MSERLNAIVIDDDEIVRMMFGTILEQIDVDVVGQAADGRAGVDMALALEPDMILLDILMPRMDGYAALKEIVGRMEHPYVVMMTSIDDDEIKRVSRIAGAQDYITKTTPRSAVVEKLARHAEILLAQNR